MEINLKLTTTDVNTLMTALGKMPFEEVYELIEKIITQTAKQTPPAKPAGE